MLFTKYSIMLARNKNILFLNLYAFSLTGGVEKVSKNFIYTLRQLFSEKEWASYSMYDKTADVDGRYTSNSTYRTFGGAKISFILTSFWKGLSSPTLILSHINLLLVAKLISFVKPKHRFILFAHGIEVWDQLPKWKVDFIRNKVEVWAVSNYTRDRMVNQHHLKQNQLKVLNNSLSPFLNFPTLFEKPKQLTEKYGLDIKNPILYTLSRLSAAEKYKGYDTVIIALAELKKKGHHFTYLLAGKADETEKLRITQLVNTLNLTENVKLLGYLSDDELSAHFLLSDIFIMPSKGEGFGIVFIEAAAHGCQIIGGNTDGSTDALLNGKLGQMVNPNSEVEIINAIQTALANHHHQANEQQQLTVKHFGFEQYMEQVNRLIANP
ncbi:Glycosyltransferase involved in cell wall bisynthesis [Pedobacter xixiisoli]|uniref:Glycosyltransferase involved in cell wall bisynthesis n=2 Tax=Pedobacter xixiisoli TaxID=1476464 RepID=A0A286A9S4_9SPHI|nr:Glycosyltransferase involved in cell wall bisynthesis [Pedobacter xixiisoli]